MTEKCGAGGGVIGRIRNSIAGMIAAGVCHLLDIKLLPLWCDVEKMVYGVLKPTRGNYSVIRKILDSNGEDSSVDMSFMIEDVELDHTKILNC